MFGDKTIFSKKDLDYRKAENSPAMKKIMSDKDMARALDEPRERQELFDQMKRQADKGSLTREKLREVLGYFRLGKGKHISEKEAYDVARKSFSSSSDRYRFSSSDGSEANVPARGYSERSGRGGQVAGGRSAISHGSFARPALTSAVNKPVLGGASSNVSGPNKPTSSFSRALRSTIGKK